MQLGARGVEGRDGLCVCRRPLATAAAALFPRAAVVVFLYKTPSPAAGTRPHTPPTPTPRHTRTDASSRHGGSIARHSPSRSIASPCPQVRRAGGAEARPGARAERLPRGGHSRRLFALFAPSGPRLCTPPPLQILLLQGRDLRALELRVANKRGATVRTRAPSTYSVIDWLPLS